MWWYYRGSVTTPVDIDGKPTVLRPKMKFEAPNAAVAHLVKIGQVVPCKAPKEVAPPPQPKSPPDVAPVVKGDASVVAAVVESVGAEPSAEVVEVEEPKAELEEAPRVEEKPEEKVKGRKSRWRDRDLG